MKMTCLFFAVVFLMATIVLPGIVSCNGGGDGDDNCVSVTEGAWQIHFTEDSGDFYRTLIANQDSCDLSFSQEYGMSLQGEIVVDRWIGSGSDLFKTRSMDIQFRNDPADEFSGSGQDILFNGYIVNFTVEGSFIQ